MMEGFKKYEKIIHRIIIIFVIGIFAYSTICTRKLNENRRLCDSYRERIADTEDTNRRLAETVGKCQSICGELGDSVDRNIRTAREAVELIEEIRIQVQSLEMVTGDFNPDDYYNYWDSVYGIE